MYGEVIQAYRTNDVSKLLDYEINSILDFINDEEFRNRILKTKHKDFIKNDLLYFNIDNYFSIIKYSGYNVLNDKEAMKIALKYEPGGIQYLSPDLQKDDELRCIAFSVEPATAGYFKDINSVKQIKCLFKGIKKYDGIPYGPTFIQMIWDECIPEISKNNPKIFSLFKDHLK